MPSEKIAVIVGSLRAGSFTRRVARAMVKLAPGAYGYEFVAIGQLPLYNQDLDANPPAEWVAFRETIRPFKGVLFATPEHNRSIPAALKNAHRRRLAALWPQRLGGQAGGRGQRDAGRDGRLRRQPSPAPEPRFPRHAGDGAA